MHIYPGIMRHAIFGDIEDSERLYIVPENEVHLELTRKANGVVMVAKFRGRSVTLPSGSAVQYAQLQAATATGGIGYPAPDAAVVRMPDPFNKDRPQ